MDLISGLGNILGLVSSPALGLALFFILLQQRRLEKQDIMISKFANTHLKVAEVLTEFKGILNTMNSFIISRVTRGGN